MSKKSRHMRPAERPPVQLEALKVPSHASETIDTMRADKKNFITTDGYINMFSKLGINSDNQSAGGRYDFGNFITRERLILEAAYRTSWLVGQVVDVIAEDMTRAGIDITSDLTPEDSDKLQKSIVQLGVWKELTNAIKWGRLYGGSVAIILIEGQDMSKPLKIDTVGLGSFKGLLVLDRWLVMPSLGDLVPDFGPHFGMPKYYDIIGSSMVLKSQRVHYSRVIRFDGIELPYLWKIAENLWSESVVERMWDRLLAFDSTSQGAAQLVFKAHLRTVQIKDLRTILAAGGKMEEALIKNIEYIRRMQTNEGITLLDTEDKFETHQYAFSGLADLLLQFGQQISGSTGIPLVRLFGQSPTGMNSTGESDLRNYYDNIAKAQESQLKEALYNILRISSLSVLGIPFPDNTSISFVPLWQLSNTEKATIASQDTETVSKAFNDGLISQKIALMELRQNSRITGRWSNITDEDIDKADDQVQEKMDLPSFMAGNPVDEPESEKKGNGNGTKKTTDSDFIESEHPREDDGKFTEGSGSGKEFSTSHLKTKNEGEKLPDHIEKLKIPPAWTNVKYSENPEADLLVTGKDKKGRTQYVYSKKFADTQAAAKFERIDSLNQYMPEIEKEVSKTKGQEKTDCMRLIMSTGIRPGSEKDTAAEKKAYGASTLEGRHVIIDGGNVSLQFTGKKGVSLNIPIKDKEIKDMLINRKGKAGDSGKVFKTSSAELLEYTHSLDGGGFKTKDFRTYVGTSTAMQEVEKMESPQNEKEYKKAVLEVAKIVARKLGNTPTIALQAYINPTVFQAWKAAL